MTAVGNKSELVFEPMIITRRHEAGEAKAGHVQKNNPQKNEKAFGNSLPRAPKYEGGTSTPSTLKNPEDFIRHLRSLTPTMSLEKFDSLTVKRDSAPMTLSITLPGKNNEPIFIKGEVRYADERTLPEFVGMALPRGFCQREIKLNGQSQVVFFTKAQLEQAEGALPGIVSK